MRAVSSASTQFHDDATDEDIRAKEGFASKIGAVTDAAAKLPMGGGQA